MTTRVAFNWLRPVGLIAAAWYAFGLYQCWSAFSAMGDAAPAWAWLTYALASGAGLLGAIALFAQRSAAVPAFAISLISALSYYVWLFTSGTPQAEDTSIAVVVLTVTTVLLIVSIRRFR